MIPPLRLRTDGGLWAELRDAHGGRARFVAVLVPGLFATSHFFRIGGRDRAGVEFPAFVDWLQNAAQAALVWFDPRGIGANQDAAGTVDFARRVADLVDVVHTADHHVAGLPLVLIGHSLGGCVSTAALLDPHVAQRAAAAVTIASPACIRHRRPPGWEAMFQPRALELVARCERDGWLSDVAFAWIQNRIYGAGGPSRALPQPVLAAGMWLARTFRLAAAAALSGDAVAHCTYRNDDYGPELLQKVLRAPVLHRESATLLRQVLRWGMQATPAVAGDLWLPDGRALRAAAAGIASPRLALGAPGDELVPPEEALAWPGAEVGLLPQCGHGGYLVAPGARPAALAAIEAFLARHVPRR